MSPEISTPTGQIMQEAERIKDALVIELAEEQVGFDAVRQQRLEGIRERLGYSEVPADEAEDLIDVRNSKDAVITPDAVAAILPVSKKSAEVTRQSRHEIGNILNREDDRLLVVTGPCSIHDPEAALEYAMRVKDWREQFGGDLEIVMRAYMEKPRTELGWKGLIYDPHLDGSDDINTGIVITRMLSSQITNQGVPIAMERLNALTPQYVNALVAYDAIGARNTTDQKAREYASGTSSPVGFKNSPDGNIMAAAQAIVAANGPHAFLGIDLNGLPSQVNTRGNPLAHLILRGGENGPNYSKHDVATAKGILKGKGLLEAIVIDASHGNAVINTKGDKDPWQQIEVLFDVGEQIALGETAINGVMIESHLVSGSQKQNGRPLHELAYGQSITDGCIDVNETEMMLAMLAESVRERRQVVKV